MPRESTNTKRLFLQISEQLVSLIQSGTINTGDRLPSERDLAIRFSVSRPTIREAMITLEMMGLVEIRSGSGVYIKDPENINNLPQQPNHTEILEAQKILQPEVAALAAIRISHEQLMQLKSLLQEMDQSKQPQKNLNTVNQEFQSLIAEASFNTALISTLKELWNLNKQYKTDTHDVLNKENTNAMIMECIAIYSAIKQRNPQSAKQAMGQHLDRVINL